MYTIGLSYHRRGTSTVLGTIIFVGIIFTAVIPMFLVMNQADTIYEMRKFEVGRLDEEKASEEINFYAYLLEEETPDSLYDTIELRIKNEGSVPIKIVRVWINDVEYPQNENINSMDTKIINSLKVDQVLTSYTVKVITEKGNIFTSISGNLYYSEGGWYTSSLGICVHIINIKGKYEITVTMGTETVGYYLSQSTDWGDLIKTFMVDYPDPVSYTVTINRIVDGTLIELYDSPIENIKIVWPPVNPGDDPIYDILVDGDTLKT